MTILGLIVTILLFVLLLWGIKKKWNLATLLLGISLLGLCYLTISTGTSVLGDSSTGSAFFDIFEYIYTQMQTNIGGTVLTVILIFGYLDVMNRIKASDTLASLLSAPLSKIKNPYLIASCAIVIGGILKIGITTGPTIAMLMVATVYPVLIASNCPKKTAAAAMFTYSCITWGPVDTACYTGLSLMGIEDTSVITSWFMQMQLPMNLLFLVVAAIVFYFAAQYVDKKENAADEKLGDSAAIKELDTPKIYALLPVLPMIFVLVFSALIMKTIVISVVTAVFVSTLITVIVYGICNHQIKGAVDLLTDFWEGMSNGLKGLGLIVMFATIFSRILNKIGGMAVIMDALGSLNVNGVVLICIVTIIGLLITWVMGTFLGSISMCIPFAASVVAMTGLNDLAALHLILLGCGVGVCLSPIQSGLIVISQSTGVEIMSIIKRNVAPYLIGLIVAMAATIILYM